MKQFSVHMTVIVLLCMGLQSAFAHPADPTGLLARYAMYAKETLRMRSAEAKSPGKVSAEKNSWMGVDSLGQIMLNGVEVNSIIKSPGKMILTGNPSTFNDFVYVNKEITYDKDSPNTINKATYAPEFKNIVTPVKTPYTPENNYNATNPAIASPNWPNLYPVEVNDRDTTLIDGDTLFPGTYGIVQFAPSVISGDTAYFKKGTYNIKQLLINRDGAAIQIVKDSGDYSRIFIKDSLYMDNETAICIDTSKNEAGKAKDTYGRVLIYLNDGSVDKYAGKDPLDYCERTDDEWNSILPMDQNPTLQLNKIVLNNKIQIDATILAPKEKVVFDNETTFNGQVMAFSIFTLNQFNGGLGDFYPFISPDVEISLPEDATFDEDPLNQPLVNNGPNTHEVSLTLSEPIPDEVDDETDFAYIKVTVEPTPGLKSPIKQMLNTDYTVTGFDSVKVIGETVEGFIKLTQGEESGSFSISIIDDDRIDNGGTFQITFSQGPTNIKNFEFEFGDESSLTRTITIVNEDKNLDPVATDQSLTILEQESCTFQNFVSDPNYPDQTLSLTYTTFSPTGAVEVTGTGNDLQLKYTASQSAPIEITTDTIFYTVTDSDADNPLSASGKLAVNIRRLNDNAPTNENLYKEVVQFASETANSINVITTAQDIDEKKDSTTLTVKSVDSFNNAYCNEVSITNSQNSLYYQIKSDVIIPDGYVDTVLYTITDPVSYDYDSRENPVQCTLFVTLKRDLTKKPNIVADAFEVLEGQAAPAFNVMTNDASGNAAPLDRVELISGPTNAAAGFSLGSLGAVTYTHNDSETESDQFTYRLYDKAGYFADATVNITVNLRNDNPPLFKSQTISISEGAEDQRFTVITKPDPESDEDLRTTFTTNMTPFGLNGGAKYGRVVKINEESYAYYQDVNVKGLVNPVDTILMNLYDNVEYDSYVHPEKIDTTYIQIKPENTETPTAEDLFIKIPEQETRVIDLKGHFDDPDLPNDVLTLTLFSQTKKAGTATHDDDAKTITYVADPNPLNENFSDEVVYTITDDKGRPANGTIYITIDKRNDNAPVANRDSVDVFVGIPTIINSVLDNDTDADKPETELQLTADPIKSGPTNPAGITITPVGDRRGIEVYFDENVHNDIYVDSIQYEIEDPVTYDTHTNRATGWLIIRGVVPDEKSPIAIPDSITLLEDGSTDALTTGETSVMTNDKPNKMNTKLSHVVLVENVKHGDLLLNSNGTFSYSHHNVEIHNDFFTYKVVDILGNESFPTTVYITITPVNDNPPVVLPDTLTVIEGGTSSLNILEGDSDPDVDTELKSTLITEKPALYGDVTEGENGFYTYQHDGSENPEKGVRIDSFFVMVTDHNEYDTQTHPTENLVIVLIQPDNDHDPVAKDGLFPTIKEGETSVLDLAPLFSDLDMPNDELTLELLNPKTLVGSATLNGTIVSYTHDISTELFADQIIYKVTDSEGQSDMGTLSVEILPINDNTPLITNDTITVIQGIPLAFDVLQNDSDADLPVGLTALKVASMSKPTRGSVNTGVGDILTYTMDLNFEIFPGVNDVDSFTYTITDPVDYDTTVNQSLPGQVYVKLLKNPNNILTAYSDTLVLKENELKESTLSLLANDKLGIAALREITLVSNTTHGLLTVDPVTGMYSYDHDDAKEIFSDFFTYTITDMVGATSLPTIVTIVIDTLNDNLPVVLNEAVTIDEGATTVVDILANDSDVDIHTTLTPTLITPNGGAHYGTATLTTEGKLLYINNGDEGVVADTVIIQIQDVTTYHPEGLHTALDTVAITISPNNNKLPTGTAPHFTLKEGETLNVLDSLSGLLHDATDGDLIAGGALQAMLVSAPTYHNQTIAPFSISPNGTFTYIHDNSENFSDAIVYDISDGLHTIRLTATISIIPVNDNAPTAIDDQFTGIEGGTITPAISLLANDSDIDLYLDVTGAIIPTTLYAIAEPLQAPTQGSVVIAPNGTFTYTHNGSETVSDSFAYIAFDTMAGVTFTDTAMVYITIPQEAPTIDSAFYRDENGDGIIEEVLLYSSDSLNLVETKFALSWTDLATPLTVETPVYADPSGLIVSIPVLNSPQFKTSGLMTITVVHGVAFNNEVMQIAVLDRAAPVITEAFYFYDETHAGNDSFQVHFSEPVYDFIEAPYNYLDLTTNSEFTMELQSRTSNATVMSYSVLDKSIKRVSTGDSIQVFIPNVVSDTLDNFQDFTIWAPITLVGTYPQDLNLLVVPQPMLFLKVSETRLEPQPLNEDMMAFYNFPVTVPTKGVAFILTGTVPLGDISLQSGTFTILDQTGNVVQESQPMSFTLNEDSEVTGVAVWEGKNRNGRTVAKSSFLCLVQVEVVTEDGEIIEKTFEKPIATYGIYE